MRVPRHITRAFGSSVDDVPERRQFECAAVDADVAVRRITHILAAAGVCAFVTVESLAPNGRATVKTFFAPAEFRALVQYVRRCQHKLLKLRESK